MSIDLKALAQTITTNKQAEIRQQAANLKTDDPQRDKHWRTVGKTVRSDVRHTR